MPAGAPTYMAAGLCQYRLPREGERGRERREGARAELQSCLARAAVVSAAGDGQ